MPVAKIDRHGDEDDGHLPLSGSLDHGSNTELIVFLRPSKLIGIFAEIQCGLFDLGPLFVADMLALFGQERILRRRRRPRELPFTRLTKYSRFMASAIG